LAASAVALAFPFAGLEFRWVVLWPSACALVLVFVLRSALAGLLGGALAGSVLLAGGDPLEAGVVLFRDQFLPLFGSTWKLSAIAFTLILGGFVALLEASGGLLGLVRRVLGGGRVPARRMQLTVLGCGLLVFFDRLANTMLLGRLLRQAADRCGVSRVKLAYMADATGSAVACLAFISTWIAFQLAMIREGFEAAGVEGSAYALFFRSIPANYYCWFALGLALVSILREYNPGPMGAFERTARRTPPPCARPGEEADSAGHWAFGIVPIFVLVTAVPFLTYAIGADGFFPFSLEKFAEAYGRAEANVPQILVGASLLASLAAAVACARAGRGDPARARTVPVFLGGVRDLAGPVLILLAAWMLGSAISQLGAAGLIAELLQGRFSPGLLPAAIFVVGALISFSTGTSWGTMAVLMPLAIPVIFTVAGAETPEVREALLAAGVGAVFSGAVFGDHCSPFSDTTIVASIASGVEPMDHVRTQLPFALLAAAVALLAGFLPLGFGFPAWAGLLAGGVVLFLAPSIHYSRHHETCN
jgi:Na+/H+ antiporter NhaC